MMVAHLKRRSVSPLLLVSACCCLSAFANDPGGGANGVGANVTLTDNGSFVTLANGILTAKITKSSAQVTSMVFLGKETVSGNIYFSMDGGSSYENPGNGGFWIKSYTTDRVDVGFRCTMTNHHWFNVDIHYVLARGDTGLYVYAELSHPANYPDTSVGEWRMVWKMPQDQTERIYVDDLRHWQKPSSYDLANAQATGIAEIVKLTTGLWAGRYTCKYMYAVEYEDVGCYGHASNPNKFGVWAVFGGYDFFNDGPTKQDLAPADGIIHIHFGRNHFNSSSVSVAAGESWTKFFGPWLLYGNTNSAGGDGCWADAKAQVQAEKGAWPYSWLTGNANYPAANARGAVAGRFIVNDPLKPGLAVSTNAWIGLAQPEPGGNWQFESMRYQYWVHPDASGDFVIPFVRPGTFTLYAFTPGAVGELSQANVTVNASATNALGNLTWNVPHPGGQIAWEIGIPDRTAKEFRHGTNYWEPYLWETYATEFPNPLEYHVGASNWTNDWNYAQPGYNVGATWSPWKWRVNFNLTNPPPGNATLTLAWAGANYGAVQVLVNDENSLIADVSPSCYGGPSGGNGLIREVIHAKYGVDYVSFPSTLLRNGANTITLLQRRSSGASDHVMYDYVNLELPPGPPDPPPGRNLRWLGGNNANAWDLNTTFNFATTNGTATTFTNGDNLTFDDSGSSSPAINLIGTLLPGQVLVNATQNYTIGGSGSLIGTMALLKTGSGRLVLNGSNGFAGGTTISSGVVQLGSGETSNTGIGGGPVTLRGGTLQLNGYAGNNGTYWGSFPNHLVVPLGASGTLLCPARIAGSGLSGQLTGGGTLNLTVDYVRGILSGDWSAFTGRINATARSGLADFRINNGFGYGNAALNLAAGVTAYHMNGSTKTIDIGELSGTGNLGPGNGSSSNPTWRIGAKNTSSTFNGAILDAGVTSLTKLGTGKFTLARTNVYSGLTAVSAGTLDVAGAITTTNIVIVSNAATLNLGGVITTKQLQINAGGTLTGCGTLNGNLLNYGSVIADCGAGRSLVIVGNVTNNGTMQILAGTGLQVAGTFVNNGLLDLLTSASGVPPNFVNNGTVLLSGNIVIQSFSRVGNSMELTIQSYNGHTYRLQRTTMLAPASWQNLGAPQDGDGTTLTFTDNAATSAQNFYRILVSP